MQEKLPDAEGVQTVEKDKYEHARKNRNQR